MFSASYRFLSSTISKQTKEVRPSYCNHVSFLHEDERPTLSQTMDSKTADRKWLRLHDRPHRDLREFLQRAEIIGETTHVKGARWDLAAAIPSLAGSTAIFLMGRTQVPIHAKGVLGVAAS
jgi:hypothetical protein